MDTQSLLLPLQAKEYSDDDGGTTCSFREFCADINKQKGEPFWDLSRHKTEITILQTLTDKVSSLPVKAQSLLRSRSVALWIQSLDTLDDTIAVLKSHPTSEKSGKPEHLVLQTFQVLQRTYKGPPGSDVLDRILTEEEMLAVHQLLHGGDHPRAYRKSRCFATIGKTKSGHVYPHHSIIPQTMMKLISSAKGLSARIREIFPKGSLDYFLHTFALASFLQFHFVDIHPFSDGNGRMCRLLSKLVLDDILPFPFPMFTDREAYLNSLIRGRELGPRAYPSLLCELLIKSAIDHYQHLVEARVPSLRGAIIADDSDGALKSICDQISDTEKQQKLLGMWNDMVCGGQPKKEVLVDGEWWALEQDITIDFSKL